MEKEQKKLLLVAVSVGVFLLVTITAAMIILTPKMQTQDNAFYSNVPIKPGNVQNTVNGGNNTLQPINNNPVETNTVFEVVPETPIVIEKTDNNVNNGNNDLIVQIPRPTTPAVPNSPETSTSTVTAVTNSNTVKPVTTQSTTTPKTTVTTPKPQTSTVQTSTVQTPKPSTSAKTINDYWIQTGAYLALIRAEDAKEILADNGLTSIIENRVIEGKLYYRVRLGPYTSEREANYWLSLVKSIDGFGESQVRQTARQL
jgi:DedD protein